ncbi:MAG: ABC transporter substrate-binding protein [Fulvivirga sp.]
MKYWTALFIIVCICSCSNKKNPEEVFNPDSTGSKMELSYASGFEVTYKNGATWVEVPQPFQGAEKGFTYLLVDKGAEIPAHDSDVQVIEVPIDKIVCTSTTHIPLLDYLDESEALVGFPTTDYISSTKMRMRIDAGNVMELGVDNEMNLELLVSTEPDMVMAYTMSSDFGQYEQIQQADIPVIINAEYLESHPLGRAEWIKFMALFFKKESKADSVFSEIEKNYNSLKGSVKGVAEKPTVLSGVVYGDTWYMPGGDNYASKIIDDAAGNYLWADDSSSGYLELSFEAVYEKAHQANYWIGVGSYRSLEGMSSTDNRYTDFEAFKNGNVYTYDARKGAKGGSEFLELGYLRPDLILDDLIKILHKDSISNDDLFFHGQLK